MEKREKEVCVSCSGAYYVQLRGVVYCAGCFEDAFVRKFRKSLRELPKNCKILVVLENNQQAVVLAHVTRQVSTAKAEREFCYIFRESCTLTRILGDSDFMYGSWASEAPQRCADMLAIAKRNACAGVLVGECLEDVVSHSLFELVRGNGRRSAFLVKAQNLDGVCMVNAFIRTPQKEVCAYFFLHRDILPHFARPDAQGALSKATTDFMNSVYKKNYGAFNNFVEALHKTNTSDLLYCGTCCQYHRAPETCSGDQ